MTINNLKRVILKMSYDSQEGHVPSAFSILDILWVLYNDVKKDEDRFVLSKGHGCLALYTVLAEKGIMPTHDLITFGRFDSILGGHPDSNKVKGVLASTGSLGHGLPIAVGMAMAMKIKGDKARVFCLVGDGECNEGSIWEAAMIAAHHILDNLTCIVDYNHSTDRALKIDDICAKFSAFGWYVNETDGHEHIEIKNALQSPSIIKPTAIIAHTIKGKGIKRMENNPEWHHKSPTEDQLNEMLSEL